MLPPLRDYQTAAVASVASEWKRGAKRVLLVMPTGSGKTRTALGLVQIALRHQKRVLWLAHRDFLLGQAHDVLWEGTGLEPGVTGPGGSTLPGALLRVATVQTLVARGLRPEADVVVWDEAHHHVSDEWGKVAAAYSHTHGFGLTATPERSDGRPLGDLFDSMVVGAHYSELIDAGHLVPARVFAPDGALSRGLASDPVKAYQAHGEGGQAFVFAGSVELAYKFAEDFNRLGISAACIEGTTDGEERKRLLERFKAGELRVLTNVYVLTEGLDVPAASVCVLARGVGHVTPYLQMVGRVLRPAPGKPTGIVIDLSGTTYKHGLPTEDREYSLTEGVKRKPQSEGSLRVCQSCGMTYPGAGACPRCGFVLESRAKPPTIYDMALREVYAGKATPEDAKERWLLERVLKEPNKPFAMLHHEYRKLFDEAPRAGIVPESIRRSEYQRLVGMAKSSGNKVGWAAHRYRNTFGDWPPREWQTCGE